jgi:acetyl esterase/lipase
MKIQKHLILAFLFLCGVQSFAQKQQTLTYFQNDTLRLDLDLFLPEKASSSEKLPLVIFVHGGGFSGGSRDGGFAFCKFMAQNGYAAATISYTLYMKNKKFSCDGILPEKIKAFNFGVNDLWLSTLFFIDKADSYHIDPAKIFIAGSSAGVKLFYMPLFGIRI